MDGNGIVRDAWHEKEYLDFEFTVTDTPQKNGQVVQTFSIHGDMCEL